MIFLEKNSAKIWTLCILVGVSFLAIMWFWSQYRPEPKIAKSNDVNIFEEIGRAASESGQQISDSFSLGAEQFGDYLDETAKEQKQKALITEAKEYLDQKSSTSTAEETVLE